MDPDNRRTRAVYVISVAAELAGIHPQTLRIYERKGLLDPARTVGGSRRYSEQDLALLERIQNLTNAGLNLEGVRRVLELETEVAKLRSELDLARRQAIEDVERTHRQYRRDLVPVNNSPDRWIPGAAAPPAPSGRSPMSTQTPHSPVSQNRMPQRSNRGA
jgi:MerR family transcriptional regulator/heat shock protein HspR